MTWTVVVTYVALSLLCLYLICLFVIVIADLFVSPFLAHINVVCSLIVIVHYSLRFVL